MEKLEPKVLLLLGIIEVQKHLFVEDNLVFIQGAIPSTSMSIPGKVDTRCLGDSRTTDLDVGSSSSIGTRLQNQEQGILQFLWQPGIPV